MRFLQAPLFPAITFAQHPQSPPPGDNLLFRETFFGFIKEFVFNG